MNKPFSQLAAYLLRSIFSFVNELFESEQTREFKRLKKFVSK